MTNAYYKPGHERGSKVRELFDRIARRYDLINDVQSLGLHRFWKRRLVRRMTEQPGWKILDVCCGTGDLTIAMRRGGAKAFGVDFSSGMLGQAARRSRVEGKADGSDCLNVGSGGLPLVQGDALQLPFGSGTFDAVTISYGLRNLAGFEAGLDELMRVLKPGGLLMVLDFGKPSVGWWRALYFGYLACAVPLFGLMFAGDAGAYAYILESLKHYPAQRGIERRCRELGCVEVEMEEILGGAMAINLARRAG